MALKGEFHTLVYDEQLSFFGKIRELSTKLKALGSDLEEVDKCQRVLAILPPEHQDIVGQMRVMSTFSSDGKEVELKLVKIESLLRQRLKDRKPSEAKTIESSEVKSSEKNVSLATTTKRNIRCHYCGRIGHTK
ncbi:hypothetical protein BLA29_013802, partial [Euroglyphus maynei]